MRLHELNFAYFSVSCAVVTQILHRNEWQFEREYNSASPPFFHLLWGRILPKKNFNFLKAEFFCANEIFLVFQFLVQFKPKFSVSICATLKENSILHLLLFFFYFDQELFIRKIFIFSKLNPSAPMKFSLFFSFLCGWDTNSPSELVTVWKRIQFCISSFSSSTLSRNLL